MVGHDGELSDNFAVVVYHLADFLNFLIIIILIETAYDIDYAKMCSNVDVYIFNVVVFG